MARRFLIGLPGSGGDVDLHAMKEWLRVNPGHVPPGLSPHDSTSHQLRDGLRRAGRTVRQSTHQVILTPPGQVTSLSGHPFSSSKTRPGAARSNQPSSPDRMPPSEGTVLAPSSLVTADDLGRWRRGLLQLLNQLDGGPGERRGVVSRIRGLSVAEKIPRVVADCMIVVVEARNVSEYESGQLSKAQRDAARTCWLVVVEWATCKRVSLPL
jgi:hypothetical protein